MSDADFVIPAPSSPAGGPAAEAPVVLTPAEADRVMSIQETIIASLRASTEAHKASAARIAQLEADRAELKARVAELEGQKANVVDPAAVQSALDDLATVLAPAATPAQG